jgi:hypothetical protein
MLSRLPDFKSVMITAVCNGMQQRPSAWMLAVLHACIGSHCGCNIVLHRPCPIHLVTYDHTYPTLLQPLTCTT